MFEGVFAAAGVHCVAVRQERLAAQLLHHVHDRASVIRAQEADVAQLAEVHFDGDKLAVHIHLADARLFNQLLELGGQTVAERDRSKIGVIDLRFFHGNHSLNPNV